MRSIVATIAIGLAGTAPAMAQQNVAIATSNPGTLFHNIGTAVANALNEEGVSTTIQPSTSPNQYIPLVGRGGIEFGVANLQEVNYGLEGVEWFEGESHEDLRVVGLIMPLVAAIFVREDSEFYSIADLAGEPMVDGYTAQQTILPQLDAMYSTAGLSRDDFQAVNVSSVVAGADAFIEGEVSGFYFAHGAGKVLEADSAVGGIRALAIEPTDENLERMQEFWPVAFFEELHAGEMPGVLEDGHYFAYPQLVFTHAGVDDETVYTMARALHERTDILVDTFGPFGRFDPEEHLVGDTGVSSYHPGAIAYFEDAGLWQD